MEVEKELKDEGSLKLPEMNAQHEEVRLTNNAEYSVRSRGKVALPRDVRKKNLSNE